MTASLCIQCDRRWGERKLGSEIEIALCPACFRKYRAKVEEESKFLRVESRAEREAVYSVFRRMMERSQIRLGKRLGVF